MKKPNYVYILKCADGTLYTGWTNDLEKRLRAHNEGRGAKYTRGRLPAELVYYETFEERSEAMGREWAIKQLTREQKLQLIRRKKWKSRQTKFGKRIEFAGFCRYNISGWRERRTGRPSEKITAAYPPGVFFRRIWKGKYETE